MEKTIYYSVARFSGYLYGRKSRKTSKDVFCTKRLLHLIDPISVRFIPTTHFFKHTLFV